MSVKFILVLPRFLLGSFRGKSIKLVQTGHFQLKPVCSPWKKVSVLVLVIVDWNCSWDPSFSDYFFSITMEGLDFGKIVSGNLQVRRFS